MAFVIADRVKEVSTSTGTGNFTLSGALAGHKSFSSRCAINDRCYYCIQAVDANGAPTGEWETGTGRYSATNTLDRLSVAESSNADTLVSFSAGTKHVFITLPARHFKYGGEALPYDIGYRDYYVRKDGSDSNSGLANTSGGAFLTIQKALDHAGSIEFGIVNIFVGDGTYNEYVSFPNDLAGRRFVSISGNEATPSSVVINNSAGNAVFMGANSSLSGVKLTAAANGIWVEGGPGQDEAAVGNIVFGTIGGSDVRAAKRAMIRFSGEVTIAASTTAFITLEGKSLAHLEMSSFVLTGTPAFSRAFIDLREQSLARIPADMLETITGSSTGKRYDVRHGSVLLNLQSLTLPGNAAGTTASGGQYATA